jgi:hypothetical protein
VKTILVPTNFSQPSQYATDTAIAIAKKARAKVVLFILSQACTNSFNVEGEVSASEDWNESAIFGKVVRNATCPVLTVHHAPIKSDIKNLVYASSLSKSEEQFSDVVKNTQAFYNAMIHLVRINTPMNFAPIIRSSVKWRSLQKNFI